MQKKNFYPSAKLGQYSLISCNVCDAKKLDKVIVCTDDNKIKSSTYKSDLGYGLREITGEVVAYSHSSDLSKKSLNALEKPTPDERVIEKISLFCNSAIDISDGFISDLNHILVASKVGAKIYFQDLPINKWIRNNKKEDLALYGGDDYQTILTAPKKMRFKIEKLIQKNKLSLTRVGQITINRKLLIDHY